jgi:predicted small secreted protein
MRYHAWSNAADKGEFTMKIKIIARLLVTTLVLQMSLTACNTIRGAGQDVKAAGGAIEKSAEKAKTY